MKWPGRAVGLYLAIHYFFFSMLASFSLNAQGQSLFGDNRPLDIKVKACDQPLAPRDPDNGFCDNLFYLRKNLQPLNDLASALGSTQVVFFGELHTNTSIKEWLGGQMRTLKSLGFTHLAMEAFNSEHQDLLDAYKADSQLRPEIVDLIASEWGWVPEENMELVDAAIAAGIDVVGMDNREELIRLGKGNSIRLRNEHMADQITALIKKDPSVRVAVLTGQMHSELRGIVEGVETTPELLNDRQITTLSFNLESGEESLADPFGQAYLAENRNGNYLLRTQPATNISGVIFTKRAVVLGPDTTSAEISDWSRNFSATVECRFLRDVPDAIICMTDTIRHAKSLLGRMASLADGGDGVLVARNDRTFISSKAENYIGHSVSSLTFDLFFQSVDAACDVKHAEMCANYFEDDLRSLVTSEAKRRNLSEFSIVSVVRSEIPDNITRDLTAAPLLISNTIQ